ncbi:MAG TPA: transporter substrate-binding protein [Chthoniobacteraceae bacterium]|nr:transporter substrate-binding protein [Chthoniobacteraceae bacterium]
MKKLFSVIGIGLSVLSASAFLSPVALAADEGKTVKVGVLHSLSGTMAISETSLRDMLLFAFDEINKSGGVLGKKIEPDVVDGASNWPLFAEKAKQLLEEDKCAVVFGCWTSVSRKSVLPVFEKDNGLLFYPVQYEGEEQSPNIFYTAEAVNQQATPAVDYLLAQGKKKFFLVGTDYVYPRTTNLILYKYLLLKGVKPEDIGGGFEKDDSGKVTSAGVYTPFGATDYQKIVADIKQFAAGGDACVINTINGDSNVPFFKEIASAGLKPTTCPVVSFSLAEDELRALPTKDLVGELGCWTYFMSLKTPENKEFLAKWNDWLKSKPEGVKTDNRVVDSPMVLSYNGVYLWKKAVEKAKSFDVDKVRAALESGDISFDGPGGPTTMQKNHHTIKNVYIGTTLANGQFQIKKTFKDVKGEPWMMKGLDEQLAKEGK